MATPIVRGDSEEKRWGDREDARVRSIVGVTTIISILAGIVNAKDGARETPFSLGHTVIPLVADKRSRAPTKAIRRDFARKTLPGARAVEWGRGYPPIAAPYAMVSASPHRFIASCKTESNDL